MRKVCTGLMLLFTALAVALYPSVSARWFSAKDQSLPPGMRGSERELVRVWVADDACGAMPWFKAQAAAFEKKDGVARIRLRTATHTELDMLRAGDERAVAPDVLILSPGSVREPGALLLPVVPPDGLHADLKRAGRYQGSQYLVPLCASGYALVFRSDKPAVTPQPTSVLGLRAPVGTPAATLAPLIDIGTLGDAYAAPPLGGALLALLGAPSHIQTAGDQTNAPGALEEGASAALMTLKQLSALARDASTAIPAAQATDLVTFASLCTQSARAYAFVEHLVSENAQSSLRDRSLLSVRQGARLYGDDMPVHAVYEANMASGIIVPNAFLWADQRSAIAQAVDAARRNNEDVRRVLDPLR